jgi:hypothetical protein
VQRDQLEHVIRAAASIADDDEIMVVGSQSVLGAHPDAPAELLRSVEADVFPRRHPDRAILIDGAIGEGSPFHETFGYYAHGVGPETAVLGPGWDARLVAVRGPGTRDATGWCLEPNDAVAAKLVAGRPHDVAFATEALRARIVDAATLRERITALPVSDATRAHALGLVTLAASALR